MQLYQLLYCFPSAEVLFNEHVSWSQIVRFMPDCISLQVLKPKALRHKSRMCIGWKPDHSVDTSGDYKLLTCEILK